MQDSEQGVKTHAYHFKIASAVDEVTALVAKGEVISLVKARICLLFCGTILQKFGSSIGD